MSYCINCGDEYIPALSCDSGWCLDCLYDKQKGAGRNKHIKAIEQQALEMCHVENADMPVSRVDLGNILLQLVRYISKDR